MEEPMGSPKPLSFTPANRPKFVPYTTMFKLDDRPRIRSLTDDIGQMLQCQNCRHLLEWRIYRLAPEKFDAECPQCGVKVSDFWKNKVCRSVEELSSDAKE